MNAVEIQLSIFEWLQRHAVVKEPLVYELAELFNVSQDSIYRRMRAEKMMTLEEILMLYDAYGFSLEDVLSSSKTRLVFGFQPITQDAFNFIDYLEYINNMLEGIAKAKSKTLYYLANDIPLFHALNTPAIASFKLFFWEKTILGFEEYKDRKFELNTVDERVNIISRKIREAYLKIPTIEIYSQQTIDTTLRQIEFYLHSGHFKDANTALVLCDQFLILVKHIQSQCETGKKYKMKGSVEDGSSVLYQVYYNEVLYSDTTILVDTDGDKMVYMTNNGLNVLRTDSEEYYEHSIKSFKILQRKSVGISGGNDRERNQTFKQFENQILRFREKLAIEIEADKLRV